jgi:hypothetical protein
MFTSAFCLVRTPRTNTLPAMLFPLTREGQAEPAGTPPLKAGMDGAAAVAATPQTPAQPLSAAPPSAGVDRRRPIAAGDLVIVYESHMAMKALVVREDGVFSNRFGQFLVKARRHRESRREGKNFCAAPPNLAVSLSCSAP